jgi:hypothetical protein
MHKKSFTVAEANELIPVLEDAFEGIRERRARLEELDERLQLLDALWGEKLYTPKNPDFHEFARCRTEIRSAVKEVEGLIQHEILARGVRFPPGGLERGLLDFPTTLDGRWVYMCWQSGESELRSWHEVDGGYAGRQLLTAEVAKRMGRAAAPADEDTPTDSEDRSQAY